MSALDLQSSPSIGAVDVPPSAISDSVAGDAPGAPAPQAVAAPGAPSGSVVTERYVVTSASGQPVIRTNDRAAAERHLRTLRGEVLDSRTERLVLEAAVVSLHDFGQPGAPVTAYRAQVQGEHIPPRWVGPRRLTSAEAEQDLRELIGAAS